MRHSVAVGAVLASEVRAKGGRALMQDGCWFRLIQVVAWPVNLGIDQRVLRRPQLWSPIEPANARLEKSSTWRAQRPSLQAASGNSRLLRNLVDATPVRS